MRNVSTVLAVVFSLVISQGAFGGDEASDIAMVKSLRDQSNKALTAHNLEAFIRFFDHDYIISYGSSIKTLSREAEITSLKKAFEEIPEFDFLRTPVDIYISQSNPLAMEHGVWRGGYDNETFYSGRYTAGWRKTDGVWKIHNELFVTLNCEGPQC